jgi:predicted ATPase/class 3 adenylate cyclase
MADLPSGNVTFLFTDVEGSTRLLHELGAQAYANELSKHRQVVRAAFATYGGVEVDTQGDAFFAAFSEAARAIEAARMITKELASGPIRVRIGVHTGTPLLTTEGYVGADVHRAARIAAAGHGGQVVVSPVTADLVEDKSSLAPLGTHRLKDFDQPISLFQLGDGEFPPLKTIANTNLPTPASSFLGREKALVAADRALRNTRLLTVIGPGGAGKTRFALELARRAREERFSDYADGVFWVPLAPLRDPALVLDTVGQEIGSKNGLREHIATKQMLLLVDNFEQVVEAAGDLSDLLRACCNLTALVTSRELLRVQGEVEFELPPLADDDGALLFCERARLEQSEDINELCRRLDGLPLAIELAAARARMLSPGELLARLSERLDFLKGGRDADPRQQTLRAAIEWSHDLLAAEERALFCRLAVFEGTWTLGSAVAVLDADLDRVESLFDKSLLRRSQDGRFFMLETIREYAREQLEESGESESLQRRHAECFVLLAQEALDAIDRSEGARQLEAERENLRQAMRWALDRGESETSLLLASAYGRLCAFRGPFGEGQRWLEAALQAGDEQAPAARARAMRAAAGLAERQGDLEQAQAFAESSLSLARSIGDDTLTGDALLLLGIIAVDAEDYDRAESLQREAQVVFSRSGNDAAVRETLGMLGFLMIARHDYAQAHSVIEEALRLSRQADDSRGVLLNVANLGHLSAREGRFQEALPLMGEALQRTRQQFDVQGVADTLEDIAAVAAALLHHEEAAVMLGGADALREGMEGVMEPVGLALHEQTLASLGSNLEADRFAAAWEQGRGMSLDHAVAYALEFIDSTHERKTSLRTSFGLEHGGTR